MPRKRRQVSKKPDPSLVAGIFAILVSIIGAIALILSAVISKPSPVHISSAGRPSILPTISRSATPVTAPDSTSAVTAPNTSVSTSKPAPKAMPKKTSPTSAETPPKTPSPTPSTSITATNQSDISMRADVIGACIKDDCLSPLSLILKPSVLENGMPIVDGSCQINWTIAGDSLSLQLSSTCDGNISTGLVLGVGTYEIIARVTTSSGARAIRFFSFRVVNSLAGLLVHYRNRNSPRSRLLWSAGELGLHVWGRAPHVRQANPVGGCPPQFAHSIMSCAGERPKIAASRSTSWVVNPRCLPLRRPSAAHTVELLGQPISSPSLA